MSSRIHTRIDPDLKQDVNQILNQLGLSESEAIRLFYHQIKLRCGLPFELNIPNKETAKTFEDTDLRQNLNHHNNIDDIFNDI